MEAPSYSKWIARAPLARQTCATSPQPRVMKILPVGTASISTPVAGVLQSACYSQSSRGPLGGITSEKNRGKRIQELGGIGAHSTNSREESAAWIPGATARVAVARRPRAWHGRRCSLLRPPEPSARAYKGSGYPGGGRSHQGLDTTCIAASSRRWIDLFFGGSGPRSSRGAFPFSLAENLLIGAIVVSSGAGRKEQASEEEMGDGGSVPLPIYSKRRPTDDSHDRR